MCILFVYTLLTCVSYHDVSVMPMSVMGFKEKNWRCELYPILF